MPQSGNSSPVVVHESKLDRVKKNFRRNWQLYTFLIPALTYFLIFHYIPMYGVQIAFKDFYANLGITGSPWIGFEHFTRFLIPIISGDC